MKKKREHFHDVLCYVIAKLLTTLLKKSFTINIEFIFSIIESLKG